MADKFLDFIGKGLNFLYKTVYEFKITRVLLLLAIIVLFIVLYFMFLSATFSEEGYQKYVTDNFKKDALVVKNKLLEQTNNTLLNQEVEKKSLSAEEIRQMRLKLDYDAISYYTKKENNVIKFYITMSGKNGAVYHKLEDYEV